MIAPAARPPKRLPSPAVSSRSAVKMIGEAAVPWASTTASSKPMQRAAFGRR